MGDNGVDIGGLTSSPTPGIGGPSPHGTAVVDSIDDISTPGTRGVSPGLRSGSAGEVEDELIRALIERGREDETSELKLDKEQEDSLVRRVLRDFQDAEAAISQFKENHETYWKNWRGVVAPKDFPFEGAANIHVTLTASTVEQMKARWFQALLGGNHIAEFSSLDSSVDNETLCELNDWFQWELDEIVDFKLFMRDLIHDVLVDGIGLGVARYAVQKRRMCSEHTYDIVDGVPLGEQLTKAIEDIFHGEEPVATATGTGVFTVAHRTREGDEGNADVSFCIRADEKLVAYVERDEVVFDGVKMDRINLEDIVVVNSATTIERIPFFGSRLWLSVHEFLKGIADGEFRQDLEQDEIQRILTSANVKQAEFVSQVRTTDSDTEESTQSKDVQGVDQSRRWLEIYRWEGWWSPDEFKMAPIEMQEDSIQIAVWVDARSRRIIKWAKLEELNKDGERSPVKFDYIVQPDRFFSIGLVEWLRHIQAELNGIHNQRLDAGLLCNVPFWLYEPAFGSQNVLLKLEPGKGYPVKDVSKVLFPKLNFQSQWSFQEEANVRSYGLEQAGLGAGAVGSFISKRTSASEWSGTQEAIDVRSEFILDHLLRSMRKLLYRIFGLYQQYARGGRVYQITGLNGEKLVKSFNTDRLQGRLRLHLTGNIQQLSAQLERDVSLNMLSLLLNQALMQFGIVKPDTIFAAIQKVARTMNYRGVPLHQPDVPPDSAPPEVEHKKMLHGEPVQPSPSENFGEHLAAHMRLASSPQLMEYMPTDESQMLLANHIQATVQLQQTVNVMRMQQAQANAQMQGTMNQMGIRPGVAGGSLGGDQAEPGSEAEGVQGGPQEGAL